MRVSDTAWDGRGNAEPHHASLWSDSRLIARNKAPELESSCTQLQWLRDWRVVDSYQMTASCLRSAEPRSARPVHDFSCFFACPTNPRTRHVTTKPFSPFSASARLGCRHCCPWRVYHVMRGQGLTRLSFLVALTCLQHICSVHSTSPCVDYSCSWHSYQTCRPSSLH